MCVSPPHPKERHEAPVSADYVPSDDLDLDAVNAARAALAMTSLELRADFERYLRQELARGTIDGKAPAWRALARTVRLMEVRHDREFLEELGDQL
jgi:hypothetical protein